jgi:RNA recognition motif-containing protein
MQLPCRLVAIKLDEESFSKRVRNLLEKKRKSPRVKVKINDILNKWTIFVTNLNTKVKPEDLLKLYSSRWQIELLFKAMKTFLKLRKINDVNQVRMQISFYLSMIAAAIVILVSKAVPATTKLQDNKLKINELSIYKMFKIISSNISKFIEYINKNIKYAIDFLVDLLTLYAKKESRPKRLSTKASLWAKNP